MQSLVEITQQPSSFIRWRLLMVILVVGGVFFFVEHDLKVSLYADYAPWADDGMKASGGNVAKGLSMGIIAGMGLLLLRQSTNRRLRIQGLLPVLVILFLVWAAASVAWSIDPPMTVRRLGAVVLCFVGALGIARHVSPKHLAVMTVAITGAYLIFGVAAELALGTFRPWVDGYRFAGTVHPNTQGAYLAILCLSAFVLSQYAISNIEKAFLFALLSFAFLFLLLTRSRTALAGMLFGIGSIWFFSAAPRIRGVVIINGIFILCLGALIIAFMGYDIGERLLDVAMLGRQNDAGLLTGRISIWSELTYYICQRPLTGYGFESFWTINHIEELSKQLHWPFREAHSSYIDTCLGVGLIGSTILFLIVLLSIHRASHHYTTTRQAGYGLVLGLLCYALISALMESGVAGTNLVSMIIGCGIMKLAIVRPENEFFRETRPAEESNKKEWS